MKHNQSPGRPADPHLPQLGPADRTKSNGGYSYQPPRGSLSDPPSRGSRHTSRRRPPLGLLLAVDLLIGFMIFAVFFLVYYILPRDMGRNAQVLPTLATTAPTDPLPTPSATAQPTSSASTTTPSGTTIATPSASPTPASTQTAWAAKFPGRFTDGAIEKTANSYRSSRISLTIEKVQAGGVTYYLADIYVADLQYLRTAFADDTFGTGHSDTTDTIAREKNAILAVNGDFYSNNAGPVVRNGVLYREQSFKDVCVLNLDGSMETFTASEFDIKKVKAQGAWQVWTFGPMLLDGGQPMQQFNSTVTPANPRTAIGYFEPGHYCLVVVDGRQPGYSTGYNMKEMSQLLYKLGCKTAFNLDGGQSSEMAFMGELANQPYHGGRKTSDIVMVVDGEG